MVKRKQPDMTELKQAEEALRVSEERIRAILNTAADAIITIDRRGIIDSVNPATVRMFGYTQDELLGQNVSILMPPPYRDEHDSYLARYLETGEARIIGVGRDVTGRRKDGSTFPIGLAVSEVDHLGLFTGIIRDISERVAAHQKLLQSERLAAIGEAMTGLAHESRNALQRSQACLDMLADQLQGQPGSLELIESIQRAQDDLHRLYEEVRDYAAPINVQPQHRHISEIVRQAWEDLAPAREKRAVRLREISTCDDLHCEVDAFALRQVFRNILENAVQAGPDPVEIQVEYSDVQNTGSPAISITFRDNGPGVKPEDAERVFQSFFTTKTEGTGLGMAIAHRIISAHGGQVAVNPDCQPGAEFIVTLPRKQP
jgi:PAS domain S-box-containing protein